jgi:hypothetical protein
MLRAGKLVSENKKIKSDFNYIVMSVNILNIIEHSDQFMTRSAQQLDDLFFVGEVLDMKVYVDVLMDPNMMSIRYDIQNTRDIKIQQLLGGKPKKDSIEITIL